MFASCTLAREYYVARFGTRFKFRSYTFLGQSIHTIVICWIDHLKHKTSKVLDLKVLPNLDDTFECKKNRM